MRSFNNIGAVLLPFLTIASIATGTQLNTNDETSLTAAAKQYAYGLMSLYKNNATNTATQDIGIWPQPHYWWEGGAAWGGMIEYSMFTGDDSHVKTLQQALTANYGPANDFILDYRKSQTGNDDQAFWALAVMSALEYQFPDPDKAPAAYLDVAINAFNNIVGRWDESSCGGGLKWQIYPENAYGYNYKNSISNGCIFAMGARLARYTGNQTYADWSVKVYDWTKKVGLISDDYEVFDGTDDKSNCAKVSDKTQWTYNNAMFLHGSAFMFDYTKGDNLWKDRTSGFLKHAESLFFNPYENATDIMFEWACETGESGRHCNLDQQSFKAYLARFMAKTAVLAPFTKDTITKYLKASAIGAAKSCSGGADGVTCGSKWYTGSWDGTSGVGQQLSALEVTQALLMIKKGTLPVKKGESQPAPTSSAVLQPSSPPVATPIPSPSTQAPPPAYSSQVPVPAPSSQALPSSQIPAPVESSTGPASDKPALPTSSPVESVPSASSNPVSAVVTFINPSKSTSTHASARYSSQLGGEFGEARSATTSCTPSVTTTVYVPAVSQTAGPGSPSVSTTLISAPSANSSVAYPSKPLEFQGAAVNVMVAASSVLGAAILAIFATLL
jgi:mannan endo-1,6-alpha-mannosidase